MLLDVAVLYSRVMYNEMELKAANLSLKNYYSLTKNLGFHRFQRFCGLPIHSLITPSENYICQLWIKK